METSIQQITRLTGVSSRALRHYESVGLLAPSSTRAGGIRYYDEAGLVRLQRILLLRQLGLGLSEIARVLAEQIDEIAALDGHLLQLRTERIRIEHQIVAVEKTRAALSEGTPIMATEALDGFDHTQHRAEVEARWGKDAYQQSDAWWRGKTAEEKARAKAVVEQLSADWRSAATAGLTPHSPQAQDLAARHANWLAAIPGTPREQDPDGTWRPTKAYLLSLADMYVADPRFAANYGGTDEASFVADAIRRYVTCGEISE